MNRSVDEMSASELNAAIDDTNFPKNVGSAASTPLDPNLVSQALGLGPTAPTAVNTSAIAGDGGDTAAAGNGGPEEAGAIANGAAVTTESISTSTAATAGTTALAATANGPAKGIIRRVHPTPLRMVSFRDERVDLPGTPRTPRTSTTPGNREQNEGIVW